MTDTFLPHNNSVFLLRIEGSQVALVEDGTPDVALQIDISDLSSLVIGAAPLKELVRLGRARLGDASYLHDIQCAIGWDEKPCNYTYF